MNNDHSNNSAPTYNRRRYSSKEYDSAMDFAKFLYDLWQEKRKNAIMKMDKTIYDNEEPTNAN